MQANAQARITGAALLPQVNLNGNVSVRALAVRRRRRGTERARQPIATLDASYELDFWGKNRAALRAAESTDREPLRSRGDRLSTVATASTPISRCSPRRIGCASRATIVSARPHSAIYRERVTAAPPGARYRAAAERGGAREPQSRRSTADVEQHRDALALLVGAARRSASRSRRQPQRHHAARLARVAVRSAAAAAGHPRGGSAACRRQRQRRRARALFLPSISLTGQGGFVSAALNTLLLPQSAIFRVAGSLTQPVFEGFRLLGNLELQQGRARVVQPIARR